jgi:outer membrane receptor protein involved in Fe transport
MKNISFTAAFLLVSVFAVAQTAIRGKLIDNETGEPMLFANVGIKGTTIGTNSDFDGNFSLESPSLSTGTYDIQISFVSYKTKTIEGVKVTEGQVTTLGEIRMEPASEQLQEVVVAAEAVKTSETAMLTMKKKSATMLDGISSEEMKLIGDGDAGQAAKRVTGVTVEGGKYIYVRGLGDRYSKSTLNGVDIPGLDPDRNTLQMDIFPTNLIDNITISKNFTAELPADFTGGLVNIDIKDMPEKKILDVSAKIGYNPDMHFNSDYLSYEGGSTDFLGFDDGTRALPNGARKNPIPSPTSGDSPEDVNDFITSFNPTLGADRSKSFMDFDFGFTIGNQRSRNPKKEENAEKDPKFGYIFSASYKTDYRYYDDVIYGEYQRATGEDDKELIMANRQEGQLGERSFLLGLLGGVAYKTNLTKLKIQLMHLQSGESRAGKFEIYNNPEGVGQSGFEALSDNLEYEQRSMTHLLINGKRVYDDKGWEVDWRFAPTLSTSFDPDIRKTAFTISDQGDYTFNAGAGGNPKRIWRNLVEVNAVAKVDFLKKYELNGEPAKFRTGANYTYKIRNYEILAYDIQSLKTQVIWAEPDANKVLADTNLYPDGPFYYTSGNTDPNSNAYQSNVNNIALYASNEWQLFSRMKTIIGLRMEYFVQRHTGRDIAGATNPDQGNVLENEKVLDNFNLFPSLNFIYALNEKQNLRFSYTRTIARPSFKELSFAQIIDPLTDRFFNGSLFKYRDWDGELVSTNIDNIDLRWELFMKGDQLFSVSSFYKRFQNPIEMVRIPEQQTTTEFQARNVGNGQLVGLEFELRKSFDFISEMLRNYKFSGNLTLIESRIDMSDREFNARKQYEKTGQTVENTRQMAGQAPYVVNLGLIYNNFAAALDAGFFYNVKGPTLTIVGTGLYPDIYQQEFHSLNFSLNKRFGEERNIQMTFNIENLLNDTMRAEFESFEASNQTFVQFNPGRTFKLGVTYKF